MEREASRTVEKRRRTRRVCVAICVAVVLLVIIVVAVAVTHRQRTDELKPTFIARCEAFKG